MSAPEAICYEDNHLLVVNKSVGMLSQGDKTGDPDVMDHWAAYIKTRDHKPGNVFLHPTHRLDRPVSGCLILAKTSKALSRMTVAFRDRKIEKFYVAVCKATGKGRLTESDFTVKGFIAKDSRRNQVRFKSNPFEGGKLSETHFQLLLSERDRHVFLCRPLTGRSHQIRVHLSSRGLPILGDVKYGGIPTSDQRLYLHCYAMRFQHPVRREPLLVKAPFDDSLLWSFIPNLEQII